MTDLAQAKKLILRYIGFKNAELDSDRENFVLRDYYESSQLYLTRSLTAPQIDRDGFIFRCLVGRSVASPYKDAQGFSIKVVFENIVRENEDSGLVRIIKNKEFIHTSLIIRFWLDCYVSSQVFLSMLMAPLKDKEWLSFEDFTKSIETINQRNVFRAFFSEKEDKKFATTMRIQKLLCKVYLVFFRLVEYDIKHMNVQGLIKVIELSNRNVKAKEKDIQQLAEGFIQRANQKRKAISTVISVSEFYDLLVTSLAL